MNYAAFIIKKMIQKQNSMVLLLKTVEIHLTLIKNFTKKQM